MRNERAGARRVVRWVAVIAAMLIASVLSGCSFGNDNYREDIPAALDGSGLGISESGAGESMSGISFTREIWGIYEDAELAPEDLPKLLNLILENNSRSASSINISFRTAADDSVDVTRAKAEYGISPYGATRLYLSMDEARKIADQA